MKLILTTAVQKFALYWGEMGTRWGVNRSVAQVHALLFLSPSPLCVDDIAAALRVDPSHVLSGIRELQVLGLAQKSSYGGDREVRYTTHSDIWELFKVIAEERKSREIDPLLEILRQCVQELAVDEATGGITRRRIHEMQRFLEQFSDWYTDIARLPIPILSQLVGMGARIAKLLPGKKVAATSM